jgi:hypothetical protein
MRKKWKAFQQTSGNPTYQHLARDKESANLTLQLHLRDATGKSIWKENCHEQQLFSTS